MLMRLRCAAGRIADEAKLSLGRAHSSGAREGIRLHDMQLRTEATEVVMVAMVRSEFGLLYQLELSPIMPYTSFRSEL